MDVTSTIHKDTTGGSSFEYNKDSNNQIYQIFRRNLNDGKVKAFVSGPGGAVRPTPSPDGKYLAFVRRIHNQSSLFLKDLQEWSEFPVWQGLERDLQKRGRFMVYIHRLLGCPVAKRLWCGRKVRSGGLILSLRTALSKRKDSFPCQRYARSP